MTIPQIAAVSVAFVAFAGLLVASKKLRVRPWIVLLAGFSGLVLALLVNILVHKTNSIESLSGGVLLICVAGALLSLMANMVVQRFGRRAADRDLHVSSAAHVSKHDGTAAEAPSNGLATAQISEIALLSGFTAARPALTLVAAGSTAAGQPEQVVEEPPVDTQNDAEIPFGQLLQLSGESNTLEEMERLERGFKRELERLEYEQEKQREQARASVEERERQALKEEERRMKEEQIKIANEAQLVRERIKRERERVAQEDKRILEEKQGSTGKNNVSILPLTVPDNEATATAVDEKSWLQEQERLARELEERRKEQEAAAEAEKLWIEEQKRLAKEEADRLAKEEADRLEKEEADRLAQEEAERLAKEEAERIAKEEAERIAKEEADRIAKAEADRIAQEEAALLTKEEAEQLAKEKAELLAKEEADRIAKEEATRLEQERQQLEAQRELEKRVSEAGEYMQTAMKSVSMGMLVEALAWMEKAVRIDTTNDMKVSNNLVIVETLIMLGWKNEALKKMQAMKTTLVIDASTKKKLGELATRLLS